MSLLLRRLPRAAVLLVLGLGTASCGRSGGRGVSVEAVDAQGSAAEAGVAKGDMLLSWRRTRSSMLPADTGRLESPFDVAVAELEQGPRGAVGLSLLREGRPLAVTLGPGPWGLTTRAATGEPLAACWERLKAGRGAAADRRFDEARQALSEAESCVRAASRPDAEAMVLDAEGEAFRAASDLQRAEDAHRGALKLREKAAPRTLALASSLASLARLAGERGLEHGAAEALWRRSLVLREELAPGSLEVAACRQGLGDVFDEEGRLADAEAEYRQALALRESLVPESLPVAEALTGLGNVAHKRGDLGAAETLQRRALALKERLAPGSSDVAYSLNRLGLVAEARGDLDGAESFYRRALAIFETLSPRSFPVAGCLNNVGNLLAMRDDYAGAKALYQRSLAIRESLGKESLAVASSINNLGDLAREHGDLDEAGRLLRRALDLKQRILPESLTMGVSLYALGELSAAQGRLAEAESFHRRAIQIYSRLAPGSPSEAGALRALGRVLERQGRRAEAEESWKHAVVDLEEIRGRLGGSGDQSSFSSVYAPYFQDLAELLLADGRGAEAFHYLERSRARGLLAMLAERDLVFADVPPELDQRRRRIDAETDRAASTLSRLTPGKDDAGIQSARETMARLREEREQAIAAIRAASPRLASLQYPKPLDLAGVRAALDPGTLLLFYGVGAKRSFLFAITSAADGAVRDRGLDVHVVGIGRDGLADRVAAFRGLVDRQRDGPVAGTALAAQAARLYDQLLRPAQGRIERAQRLLVVADGPLHVLPFAALRPSGRLEQSLVEWKPLHTVASATVYAELLRRRRSGESPPGPEVEAFGDPQGRRPLPHSREEVGHIASLYGAAAATYLGPEATEARARTTRATRYVHFASHGILDRRFPLESGIELAVQTRSDGDDGVLHAWEVFERVRIDADLVTLSACETGLGREWPGEGLVGLARAFQYAGARSVLASLWAVEDRSTAALMDSFYRALRSGLSKDEALRAAQVERSRAGDPPFRWAAFQLSGDWK